MQIFNLPVRIIAGSGSTHQMGDEIKKLGYKRVYVVTDRGVYRAGLLTGTLDSLKEKGIAFSVFEEVEVDPGEKTVRRCAEEILSFGAKGIITIGGGSAMCAAKGAALLATNGGEIGDYKGFEQYKNPPLPVVAVPTTAGSGSEVSPKFILTQEETGEKMTIGGEDCFPKTAFLDPELLMGLPKKQAVVSAVDALSHAIEAFVAKRATPITDALAWQAVDLYYRHLYLGVIPGENLASKEALLYASAMANMACGNAGLGLVHALQQGLVELSHGAGCGLLLPEVMAFNMVEVKEKLALLATALGVPRGLPPKVAAWQGIEKIRGLFGQIGFLPTDEPGFKWRLDLQDRINRSFQFGARLMGDNPRSITEKEAGAIFHKLVHHR